LLSKEDQDAGVEILKFLYGSDRQDPMIKLQFKTLMESKLYDDRFNKATKF